LALGVAETTNFDLPDGVRASPEKFMTYVPNVPLIQPAIDQPPPVKYGEVPIVPNEQTELEDTNVSPATEVLPLTPESGTNNASSPPKLEVDPF
jgi:hypothetical protein